MVCKQCPRQCGVIREDRAFSDGFCRMPSAPRIARAALHFGEEPCISGKNGSGTVFFSGCSLSCVFCQNREISHQTFGKTVSVQRLSEIFRELEDMGAHNINLVNPTHYATAVREAISLYKPHIPIVYNTSGYERVETLRSLDGLIDVYLPDLKYVHAEIAQSLSGAEDYFAFAAPAILEMAKQTGQVVIDQDGMMRKGTMVRHLVLPGHTKESMAVLDWLASYKDLFWISILFQYTPIVDVPEKPSLSRSLSKRECEKIWEYMQQLEITNGFIQDKTSSGTKMIPEFDLTGV